MPVGLNNVEMLQEHLQDGEVTQTSTYQFFMTQDELNNLAKALMDQKIRYVNCGSQRIIPGISQKHWEQFVFDYPS